MKENLQIEQINNFRLELFALMKEFKIPAVIAIVVTDKGCFSIGKMDELIDPTLRIASNKIKVAVDKAIFDLQK